MLLRKFGINRAKRRGVAAAVVGGQADLHQQRLGTGGLHGTDHLVERLPELRGGKTAQSVIAAKFHQHPARMMLFQQRGQARQPLLRRIAANTAIDNTRLWLPLFIEQGRPRGRCRHAIARAQAVTQNQQRICRRGATG